MHTGDYEQLKERAKELQCIYFVEEILADTSLDFRKKVYKVLEIIPDGWQYPGLCNPCLKLDESSFTMPDFESSGNYITSDITVDDNIVGELIVYYSGDREKYVFLPEEQKLLNTIADRLAHAIFHERLQETLKVLKSEKQKTNVEKEILDSKSDEHWKWRRRIAERIADYADMDKLQIKAIYLVGSVKEGTSGPASDIDLIVYIDEDARTDIQIKAWINGWSQALTEFNYKKTGYKVEDGLIDLHIVSDEDIRNKDSFAMMISSKEPLALLLRKKK